MHLTQKQHLTGYVLKHTHIWTDSIRKAPFLHKGAPSTGFPLRHNASHQAPFSHLLSRSPPSFSVQPAQLYTLGLPKHFAAAKAWTPLLHPPRPAPPPGTPSCGHPAWLPAPATLPAPVPCLVPLTTCRANTSAPSPQAAQAASSSSSSQHPPCLPPPFPSPTLSPSTLMMTSCKLQAFPWQIYCQHLIIFL